MQTVQRSFARNSSPYQMELQFWPRGTLKEALSAYKRMKAPHLAEETLRDYGEKENWLLGVFGESCPIDSIGLEELESALAKEGPMGRGMMGVTIKKRFWHLRAAIKYAAGRKIIKRDEVPDLPFIKNDGRPGQRALGVAEFNRLRLAMCGRFRTYADLAMWTGHHSTDIWTFARWMLDPLYEWKDDDGNVIARGRFWRRNHKYPSCKPCWIPMEEELQKAATEILAEPGSTESLILGRVWGLSKAFNSASDRCEMPRVCPSRDLRRSFASMLAARGYTESYIRIAQGHAGSPEFAIDGTFIGARRPTVDTRHYIRPTNEMMVNAIKGRPARAEL
jgi:hypothetical protein